MIFNIGGVRAGCHAEGDTVNIAFDIQGISLRVDYPVIDVIYAS
jgi:hypothetical protein